MVMGANVTVTLPIVNRGAAVCTSHLQRVGSTPSGSGGQSLESVADTVVDTVVDAVVDTMVDAVVDATAARGAEYAAAGAHTVAVPARTATPATEATRRAGKGKERKARRERNRGGRQSISSWHQRPAGSRSTTIRDTPHTTLSDPRGKVRTRP
jgi:hypothetical protein